MRGPPKSYHDENTDKLVVREIRLLFLFALHEQEYVCIRILATKGEDKVSQRASDALRTWG